MINKIKCNRGKYVFTYSYFLCIFKPKIYLFWVEKYVKKGIIYEE